MSKLDFSPDRIEEGNIEDLHLALKKLKLNVAEDEIKNKRIGESTINAIKNIQSKYKIDINGKLDERTLNALNTELFDAYIALNKTRTKKLHELLEKNGLPIPVEEKQSRMVGDGTRKAIISFQERAKLPADGKISENILNKLHEEVIKKTYNTPTQIGKLQVKLQHASKIAKLPVEISPEELKNKKLGESTSNVIKAIQAKYNLPQTGELDKATLDKIQSISTSKGVSKKVMKRPSANSLTVITKPLRLNMVSQNVAELQKALSYLGYSISEKEYKTQTYGKTTREAVLAFQKKSGLPETGHIESDSIKIINREIIRAYPDAETSKTKYRIRGSVRDECLQRRGNMVIHVYEKLLDGENQKPLATKKNHTNGFFDISYFPPIDKLTGKVKERFHLMVKLLDANDNELDPPQTQIYYNVPRILWVNFNIGEGPYKGDSEFSVNMRAVIKALGDKKITDIVETSENRQVTQISKETKLSTDDIMRLILSHQVANNINKIDIINAEVIFAFIRQNLPPSLPGDLLRGTNDWQTIDQLIELTSSGIVFTNDDLLEQAIDTAITQNLVSFKVKQNKSIILQVFNDLRNNFTLNKPILMGNGSLKSLLDESAISDQHYSIIADAFVKNRGINDDFWKELDSQKVTIGEDSIKDFEMVTDFGNISKNHIPTVKFLRNNTGSETGKRFKKSSDIAKLDHSELVALINENDKKVPDNIPGNTLEEKVDVYASVLKARSEFLFPAVSLVSAVKKEVNHKLEKLDEVEKFVDDHTDFNFRQQNLDKYLLDNSIKINDKTKEELKIIQRVQKLTTESNTGKALILEGMHSSAQIYFAGKNNLINKLEKRGVEVKSALKLFENAKMQYTQILARLLQYRSEIHFGTPQAITPQTFTEEEIKESIGDIPNLEVLFGSMDFCECQHCKSLYGPAAYLTDLLRFLGEHDSLVKEGGRLLSVKEILFKRRPDIGNIKLNCENTNTLMPYIDLVCEILENNIEPQNIDFNYQTTLTEKELRAMPQYIRTYAYDILAKADYPMNSSFNLWQEETRTYLNYLRIPRYELMEAFQDMKNKIPDDVEISAEYFGISSYEIKLIITENLNPNDQKKYWHFDPTKTSVSVSEFMERTKLSYNELLELLLVKFVNDPELPSKSAITRPADTCNLDAQTITNLSLQRLDLMHRFIRLWRKSGWKMWELDLLIRNTKIGNNQINAETINNLKKFKQLQEKLALPFEVLLAFYGDINTEKRIKPDQPGIEIAPLYDRLFQNLTITNPLDTRFKRPLNTNIVLGVNNDGYNPVPTILSALAIRQSDLDILKTKTDNHLSDESLSSLLRYVSLANGLKLSVKELWLLMGIVNISNPFSSVQATLDFIKDFESIKSSGLSMLELDYILNYSPNSSIGLREESIAQLIDSLRKIIVNNEKIITELGLTESAKNTVLLFNPNMLLPLTPSDVVTAIQPLKDKLNTLYEGFKRSNFSVEEIEYIRNFDPNKGFTKDNLVSNIKSLQENLKNLLKQNNNQILSHVASSFNISEQHAEMLLKLIIPGQTKTLIEILSDKSLIAMGANGNFKDAINSNNFPLHFKVYSLLYKISILVQRMKIDVKDLEYFQVNNSTLETLNLSALPLDATISPNAFKQWLNLYKFLDFKSKYPEPEDTSLREVLDKAKEGTSSKPEMLTLLSKLTQWNKDNLDKLDTGLNLDYTDANIYFRLEKCYTQMKLTGVNAETMLKWARRDDETIQNETAQQVRLAIKSKYESEDWLEKIRPLQDDLREKKRKALVEYHIENSQRTKEKTVIQNGKEIPNPLYWYDSNALYKYFLIDVEMSPCQLTSRIKQAISSVQFFVQRCFLNLENRYVQVSMDEKEDKASENAWSQWKWMKNYRIWEANRKVLFYPENWIEPELRDNKSPFFEELENEIMQNEITHDNVESAFLNYLHKVDEVSHLEICGLYHEMEELNPNELGYEINNVHVIARTRSIPAVYYYRKYDMNYSTWSAWEKIDMDITGDQVIPVVYNRKLHVFWLVFMEKSQKVKKNPPAKPSDGPKDAPEPQKVLEVQLAWTIRRENGWSPKKISSRKLIHPWERPRYSYNLKPYYKSITNELWLDIYLSTSKEFNDGEFYDPFVSDFVRVTRNYFNETYLPWHSASFVFDGDVKDVKLKGLRSYFHYEFPFAGKFNIDIPLRSTSYDYVHENFGEDGKKITQFKPDEDGPRLGLPNGMHFQNNRLTNNQVHSVNNNELRVLETNANNTTTTTLIKGAINPFELVITQQDLQFNALNKSNRPFFYQDSERAFFIKPEWQQMFDNYGRRISDIRQYRFFPFYHPYTTLFIRELNRSGLDGLLNRKVQTSPQTFTPKNNFNFNSYKPTSIAVPDNTAKNDNVDFSFGGAYSIYNWEIFFHAPLMIATLLSQNQRFEEAMRWFHYIFDPTNIEALPTPQRYWVTKPFFEYNSDNYRKQRIECILSNLDLQENSGQLKAWRNNPFKPHLIALYRPVAYQRNVVMKYIDNLIAWGDQLFRRDTLESINEASLLYILAYEILGKRPRRVPNIDHKDLSFNEIESALDKLGNARVDVIVENSLLPIKFVPSSTDAEPIPKIDIFYFCIPNNDKLLEYWDKVEDRLFKIRHCMNIEGVVRQLPLFEPPIDPALLVKAAAENIDLSSVLNDISVGSPPYRFRVVVQKAIEFCNEVKTLGDKLLSVLEKKDTEGLALLRSQHEIQLLEAVKEIKKKQVDEAIEIIGSLIRAKEMAEEKKNYYEGIPRMNEWEIAGAISHGSAIVSEIVATVLNTISAGVHLIPKVKAGAAGFGGTPTVTLEMGGENVGNSLAQFAALFQGLSSILHSTGNLLELQGNYDRRDAENKFQGRLATIEIDQLQFQINAAQIRQAIAEKDLDNQDLQIDNAKTIDEYMRSKYTNEKLYNWMITRISTVYFQAYQLAYDMAKKAEKCYQHELGIQNSSFIQFGYWDSLKKGLLSGEKLMNDLRRLESAYIDQNKRELEISKDISLAQFLPLSLIALKETGKCTVLLPEWLFDMDYPGHYMRRIKSVSISIPCVAGPYTNVNCTLSLTRNEIRMVPTGEQYEKIDENDSRFRTQFGSISSIATSHGQRDSGMFELNFNDDRYLPFEGAGVISEWQINMPKENNYFDFSTISDLILHVDYTARDGGSQLANKASSNLKSILPDSSVRLFSLKHEFPNEWYRFLNPIGGADQELVINLKPENYPFFLRDKIANFKFSKIEIFVESKQITNFKVKMKVTNTDYEVNESDISPNISFNNVPYTSRSYTASAKPNALGELRMMIKTESAPNFKSLADNDIDDLFLLCHISS